MAKPYFATDGLIALSHRGFSPEGLENTLTAMEAALKLGFRYLEIDVRTTRDGVVMVFHDERLERVTDGSGRLADHSFAELSSVRVRGKERIPTLAEVFERWPDARLNVDIKDDASVQPFVEVIEQLGVHERVLVASFSDRRRLRVLRRLSRPTASSAGMAINALIKALSPFGVTGWVARLSRVDCLQVPRRFRGVPVVTSGFVRRCNRAGIPVHVWTINERPLMEALLAQGVSGLISDRADVLSELMHDRGHWTRLS